MSDTGPMVFWFCCYDTVFSGRCYRFIRLVICYEKRNNTIDYVGFIYAMLSDEISHRMLEERSTNPNKTCNLY